jgi:prolyl-tRNA synthetase
MGRTPIPWKILGVQGERALAQDAISVRCLQTADGAVPPDPDAADVVAVVGRSY